MYPAVLIEGVKAMAVAAVSLVTGMITPGLSDTVTPFWLMAK